MCANCGCGYVTYDDIETGAPANEMGYINELTEKSEIE
jgi:hypothetical protein